MQESSLTAVGIEPATFDFGLLVNQMTWATFTTDSFAYRRERTHWRNYCNREMLFRSASESCTFRIRKVIFRAARESYPV
jgi:hypothetical protein